MAEDGQKPPDDDGIEPDPRFTFANERTFLAWTRTALSFGAVGGVVLKREVLAGLILLAVAPVIYVVGRLAYSRPGKFKLVTATIIAVPWSPSSWRSPIDQRTRRAPRLARRMVGLLSLDPDRVLRWVQESAGCPALAKVAMVAEVARRLAVLRADGARTNSGVSVLAIPARSGRMKQGPLHV